MEAAAQRARKMPYSIEAEQSVLGCILISNTVADDLCTKLREDDFYGGVHKTIFSCMQTIIQKNQPVDYVTLVSELERTNKLNDIGGLNYIISLTNIVPTASNYEHYANIVQEDGKLRKLLDMGTAVGNMCYDNKNSQTILEFVEKSITDLSASNSDGLTHIKQPIDSITTKFESIAKDPSSIRGLTTGFYGIDKLTNGLQGGDLVLIAARPGVGKTSLAMNIVTNCAIKNSAKCAVFSLEMPKEQLAQRALCSHASVSMENALKGELSAEDWTALWRAKKDFVESNIYVDDSSLATPMQILKECRKLKREKGLDLVMIDYVQLMNTSLGTKQADRQQEISTITRLLKITAKELNVPIILLSQLSRAPEQRTDHRPMLSDLRESGAIEQDADIVMFIYNPDMYKKDEEPKPGFVDLIVAKHRNGGLGTIRLKFIKENTTFVNLNSDANAKSLEENAPADKNKSFDKKSFQNKDLPKISPIGESDLAKNTFK